MTILRTAATLLVLFVGFTALPAQTPPASPAQPKLVVIVVVDQLRADYLDRYASRFTGGFARLKKEGAVFAQAAYPYLNTVTCAGHATIGTGTFPYRHGMVMNGWFDRRAGRAPLCTDDDDEKEVSYGGLPTRGGDSPKKLLVPAIGETLRDRARGRAVTLSLKPRSSMMLAGKKADVVLWFDDRGAWTSSTWYGDTLNPVAKQFIDANPVTADANKIWDRLYPPDAYQGEDDAAGERILRGWQRTFPHPLGALENTFFPRWTSTPFADEYLQRMSGALVQGLKLGKGAGTDFLGVSFSTLDLVGHAFGPRSHEVQDVVARLDVVIGRLLDTLDSEVGKGQYVLALSADHGVADIPEQVPGAGRLPSAQITAALQERLVKTLGPNPHVAAVNYTDIYLMPEESMKAERDRRFRQTVIEALQSITGIERAMYRDEVSSAGARTSTDPQIRAAALSFHRDRSGDFIVIPRENWILSTSATTHGTLYPYDARVPVIFFGSGIKPGVYTDTASPADIAPTLAALAGVPMKNVDGRVLTTALQRTPAATR